jgi:hypothetical protein
MDVRLTLSPREIETLITALWALNETQESASQAGRTARLARHLEAMHYYATNDEN